MIKQLFFTLFLFIILFCSVCLGVLFYVTEQPWVDFSTLENYNPGKSSILLDDEGNEWARFQLDKREVIKLSTIPQHVINAFIAAEDWNFFKHAGLSVKGIARSLVVNVASGRKAQGASTITQQLVRLLFFENEKSFKRKIKEQITAIVVERQFTKEQILETYVNHIYLGSGIYGIEAASQRFWGKPITQVSIDEAAVLAAIVRSPAHYCPLYNPESARKRRNLILKNMASLGFITKQDYDIACQKPVTTRIRDTHSFAPHLKETIRLFLEDTVGKQKLYSGGLKIQTTLNRSMQQAAEKAFYDHFKRMEKRFGDLDGALFCIEGATGAIKALIGGRDFQRSQYNRALQAKRQMGSTFKPLICADALSKGRSFSDIEVDEPITLTINNQEWSPRNSTNTFTGPMTLAHALSTSNNIVIIKTFLSSGPDGVIKLARECGLQIDQAYPSLALGCVEASPAQAVCCMNLFAHQGMYVEPFMVQWIKDEWGTKLWKATPNKKQVLSPTISGQVGKVLMHRIEKAKKARPETWFDCDALGKTGTTNDSRTCFFIGATPRYSTAVYVGYDDNRSIGKDVFGAQTAFPIFKEFNKQINNDIKHFTFDPGLREKIIHGLTGSECSADDPQAIVTLVP